jgi:nicotinamidase-related amidase
MMATDTTLLVIDMQVGNVANAYRRDEIVARVADLIAAARAADTPVVFVQHEEEEWPSMRRGGADWQFHPDLTPVAGELVINKRASDSFYDTPLLQELGGRGIEKVVVAGVMTELCIDATCRRASSEGFDVTLVSDAHTTEESPVLSAAQIIAHHNRTLGMMPNPEHPIAVRPRAEVAF